jgi:predicted adenylyl cyclase CyaB
MKNIELKVKIDDVHAIASRLRALGSHFKGTLKQIDTYYHCHDGRLKLRMINGNKSELIFYRRPDTASHKISEFEILRLPKKQCRLIQKMLKSALGIKVTVFKERKLWMYKNTRIHLDLVRGLGCFLELESQIKSGKNRAQKEYEYLLRNLALDRFVKIKKSYSDLLLAIADHGQK